MNRIQKIFSYDAGTHPFKNSFFSHETPPHTFSSPHAPPHLHCLLQSEYCILSSGLGNFIESVGKNKNILFLPPINYSQLLQLDYYSKECFGFDIINWSNFEFYKEISKFLDEETGVNMVVSNIKYYLEKDYRNVIQKRVNNFLKGNQNMFFEKRCNYINQFDKNSSEYIAKLIINDLNGGENNENTK